MIKQFLLSLTILIHSCTPVYASQTFTAVRVSTYEKKEFILHTAQYKKNMTIITMLGGPFNGFQEIFIDDECVNYSNDIEMNENFFLHFYPDFFVYSNSKEQYIQVVDTPTEKKCLEQRNVTTNFCKELIE